MGVRQYYDDQLSGAYLENLALGISGVYLETF